MPDDAHRVGEALRRIGVIKLSCVVRAAHEMRDEVSKPRNCDGSKDHTSRPHTQTVRRWPGRLSDLERCVARNACDGCCQCGMRPSNESLIRLDRSSLAEVLPAP